MDGLTPPNQPLKLTDFGVMALALQQPCRLACSLSAVC
jgi:hypothetical protein